MNEYLPANAQDIDNLPLTDPGEIKKLVLIRRSLNGKSRF